MDIFRLPYGLRDGNLLTIEDVDSGFKCNCVCPTCKKRLIARKGQIKQHHFAHDKGDDCGKGIETATHIISKEFIKDSKYFTTPPIYFPKTRIVIVEEAKVPIDSVTLETRVGSIVPDIVIKSKGKELLVEITVTHGVDYEKLNKIRDMGLAGIEIAAGHLIKRMYSEKKYFLNDKDYKTELTEESTHKRWLNNPRADKLVERIKSELKSNYCEPKEVKCLTFRDDYLEYVDKCPLNKRQWKGGKNMGQPYANIHSDCHFCKFKIALDYKIEKARNGNMEQLPTQLYCAGYLELEFSDLIRKISDQYTTKPER